MTAPRDTHNPHALNRPLGLAAGLALCGAMVGHAAAQPVPDYDFQWRTVGAVGNRPADGRDTPFLDGYPVGRVDYEYRLSLTEVTVAQWFEFVQAYAPYYTGFRGDSRFTSIHIFPSSLDPAQDPGYFIVPGTENYPAGMSWHMAARYVNWLNNGKAGEQWAFETGAYDTSTFGTGPDGATDQLTHDPHAQFWIPSLDEWNKAAYYDPNRYGPGQEGYWLYPDQSDDPLISALPEDGGTTNAGIVGYDHLPVGMYPDVQSPWGLLDLSGGVSEWTETSDEDFSRSRSYEGTSTLGDTYINGFDLLGIFGSVSPRGLNGLRIASAVPDPGSVALWLMLPVFARRRRRVL